MSNARRKKKNQRWHPRLEIDTRDPIANLLDMVLETPQAKQMFESVQDLIDRAGNAIDPRYHVSQQKAREAYQKHQPPPPPPPREPQTPPIDVDLLARRVMHFGPEEILTKERIMKQRRTLAAICHPDKGGSTEAMKQLNEAATLLLQKLK